MRHALDRKPLDPFPISPFVPAPEVQAAIDRFRRRLSARDPLAVAMEVSPVAMVVADPSLPDIPLIYVNEAFARLTGFAAVEVLGRNCRFMQGPLTEEADVGALRDAIVRRERIEIDLLNHRRDGTPFWNRLAIAPCAVLRRRRHRPRRRSKSSRAPQTSSWTRTRLRPLAHFVKRCTRFTAATPPLSTSTAIRRIRTSLDSVSFGVS